MSDVLAGLTPEQREAAVHREGPLLIIAGAGSGKTRTVTRRIAHLIRTGVRPTSILAITFTNKAAGEMRERVAGLLPELRAEDGPTVSTFHAFAVRVLRKYAKRLGYPKGFSILSPADRLALVREAAVSVKVDVRRFNAMQLSERIGRAKESLDDEGFAARAGNDLDRAAAQTLPVYRELQRRRGALDFDDLVAETVKLLEDDEEVRAALLEQIHYVMVDEYQDTNHAQYKLANLLAGERCNLAVCGDPDQSIYAWRGADMGNILSFEKDYPGAKVVLLERNYRSTARILHAANELIKHNEVRREKQLLPNGAEGALIDVLPCGDADMEADTIARRAKKLVDEGVPPCEIAVAIRGKIHAPRYEDALVRHGVPCTVVGSTSFFERREIKDALAYVRLAVNPQDDMAALRALKLRHKGIGPKTLDKLYSLQRREGVSIVEACERARKLGGLTPSKRQTLEAFGRLVRSLQSDAKGGVESLVNAAIAKTNMLTELDTSNDPQAEARQKNLKKLATAARQSDRRAGGKGHTQEFLDRLALIDAQDKQEEDPDRVVLTTVHASKGLEFDVVFVAGMEDGLFPHHRSVEEGMLEEERRLAYVAMTRARKVLILTYANVRRARTAALSKRKPSRFLYELPPELLWDPVFKEQLVLPDPAEAEKQEAEKKEKKAETKTRTKRLLGVSSSGGKTPLWKQGLLKSRK